MNYSKLSINFFKASFSSTATPNAPVSAFFNSSENAMIKRIMVDFTFFKKAHKNASTVLLQLESQLGGDYSDLSKKITYGSFPTHTILSYFDVDLNIITLLEGERRVDKPIHKKSFYKELKINSVERVVKLFKELLKPYL